MTNCVKQGTAGVTRFILITMVSCFGLKREIIAHFRLTPRAPPQPADWARGPIWKRRAA